MSGRRLLPHPMWTVVLAATWLSIAGSFRAGHVLLAVALGLGIPYALRDVWPARPPFRRPWLACVRTLAFLALVLGDVLVANLQVARAVLGPVRRLQPGFATVPLDLDDERAIVVLAHTVTLTPGTLSVEVAADRRSLVVHALHLPDPERAVREIKERYERRVAEIYAC